MEKEKGFILIKINIVAISNTAKWKVGVNMNMLMEMFMKVICFKVISKVMDHLNGMIFEFMKESGNMIL